jgi:hypothetical protein
VAVGGSATFSVNATGTGPFTYQWFKNGVAVASATGSSYTVTSAQPANAGSYMVAVTGIAGSVMSSPATLAGINATPTISVQPGFVNATVGGSATLSVTATGSGSLTYQWRKAGVPIVGGTGASYTFTNAALPDSGLYDVVLSDGLSVTQSQAGRVSVYPAQAQQGVVRVDPGFGPML